jgi:hypothetical protein
MYYTTKKGFRQGISEFFASKKRTANRCPFHFLFPYDQAVVTDGDSFGIGFHVV